MNITDIVIGIAVLAFLIVRQLQRRTVSEDSRPVILLVLLVIGVVELGQYLHAHPAGAEAVGMLVASLVLAGGFGAARAYTVRLWREGGTLYRQGTVLTLVLWVLAVGVHFGADALIDSGGSGTGLASSALLLYLGVTLGVQRMIVQSRARRFVPATPDTAR